MTSEWGRLVNDPDCACFLDVFHGVPDASKVHRRCSSGEIRSVSIDADNALLGDHARWHLAASIANLFTRRGAARRQSAKLRAAVTELTKTTTGGHSSKRR